MYNLSPDSDTFCEKFSEFIRNTVPYSVKGAISLKIFYLYFILVTGLIQVLHPVAKQMKKYIEPVNKIISWVKKIFRKVEMRVKKIYGYVS